jgi:serine/threonine protein kinase
MDKDDMNYLEREVMVMSKLSHENIVKLFTVRRNKRVLCFVLEHVDSGELLDYIVENNRLSEKEARRLFRQIVSAMDYCHRSKVCHRGKIKSPPIYYIT